MHAHFDARVRILADGEQLYLVAEFLAVGDILARYLGYPLAVHVFERYALGKREGRKYGQLIRRVEPFDVRRRIEFRIA